MRDTPHARPGRPIAVLAMAPALTRGLFRADHVERLHSLCRVPDDDPLARFDDPRADVLLAEAEILLTAWGCPPLEPAVLERAPRLKAVVHAAGTVKHHVTEACFDRQLAISSAAAANAIPVAEYTLAAILFANKRVFQLQRRYREVRAYRLWAEEEPGLGNLRKSVGIVGASRIGRRVIGLLRPFDLDVLLHDPWVEGEDARQLGARALPLDELLAGCDVVSLHAPAVPETRHMLDARRLALLRDGATLVNTARGALVDGKALERELVSGRISAVLDTTDPEILPSDSPLYELPNVFLTPHIAGSLGDETWRMTELALDEIERLTEGRPLRHPVHREEWDRIA